MAEIYRSENGKGFQDIDLETPYKYVTMQNIVMGGGNPKTENLIKFYIACINDGKTDLIKPQNPELLATLCDFNGLKLIDHAFTMGDYDFVRFLVEECGSRIDDIPLRLGETMLHLFLNDIDPVVDEKLIEHAKIAAYLIKEGAYAFRLDDFELEEDKEAMPFEAVLYNMQIETVNSVGKFLDKCVKGLGHNVEVDEKLLDTIDIFIRIGFMPAVETMGEDNYNKYNIGDLISLSKRNVKISNKLTYVMEEYTNIYYENYLEVLNMLVKDANVEAGTFSAVEYNENDKIEIIDYSNEEDAQVDYLDDYYVSFDEENENEELEYDDYDFSAPSKEELDNLDESQRLSEEELELEEGEELELERSLNEEDIIPKYDLYELGEIANKNPKYVNESKALKGLYEDETRFNRFLKIYKAADTVKNLAKFIELRQDFIKTNMAARLSDEVDDMLDPTDTDEAKEQRSK